MFLEEDLYSFRYFYSLGLCCSTIDFISPRGYVLGFKNIYYIFPLVVMGVNMSYLIYIVFLKFI